MKQFRIGRVQEPWTNLDPPIRSPEVYYPKKAQQKAQLKAGAAKKADKESVERSRRSRTSVDLSSVRLLPTNTVVSRVCAVSIC
jgi:delta8-fatty-acid desaturase